MNLALRARLIWGRTFGAFMGFAPLRTVGLSKRGGMSRHRAASTLAASLGNLICQRDSVILPGVVVLQSGVAVPGAVALPGGVYVPRGYFLKPR